jgi:hypothetical protein
MRHGRFTEGRYFFSKGAIAMVDLYRPGVNKTGAPTLRKTFYTGFDRSDNAREAAKRYHITLRHLLRRLSPLPRHGGMQGMPV